MNRDLNKCVKCVFLCFYEDGKSECLLAMIDGCINLTRSTTQNIMHSESCGKVSCEIHEIHENLHNTKFFSIAFNGKIIIVSKYLWTEKDGDDPAMLKRINEAFELVGHKKTEEEVELILNMFERMRK
jgi:hypothetical protein